MRSIEEIEIQHKYWMGFDFTAFSGGKQVI
jgi:hypothetical protein